jgi:hypothetical protein
VQRKQFFFEKKNQKTFTFFSKNQSCQPRQITEQKFFGSFFQKRTASLLCDRDCGSVMRTPVLAHATRRCVTTSTNFMDLAECLAQFAAAAAHTAGIATAPKERISTYAIPNNCRWAFSHDRSC